MIKFQKILFCLLTLFLTFSALSCFNKPTSNKKQNNFSPFLSIPDTFEEYEKTVYMEPFKNGVYIVNGDTPMENKKELKKFYNKLIEIKNKLIEKENSIPSPRKLIIEKFENGTLNRWSDAQKLELTYCISKSTCGSSYRRIVDIMEEATESWEEAANIDFIHLSEYDDNCDETTEEVLFDVRLRNGLTYEARSFFPGQSRETRNIILNSGFVYRIAYLTGLLKHELGHILGFRHEHIRPEANSPSDMCMDYGYGYWEALTEYDSDSVMNYPYCGGTAESFELTDLDREGASGIYGAPVVDSIDDPVVDLTDDPAVDPTDDPVVDPIDDPISNTETLLFKSQSLSRNQMIFYDPINVIPGTKINIKMSGTGDADIYVKYDLKPGIYSYDSRAYSANSNENITMKVPSLAGQVYIMIHGYKDATVDLEISYAME